MTISQKFSQNGTIFLSEVLELPYPTWLIFLMVRQCFQCLIINVDLTVMTVEVRVNCPVAFIL